MSGSVVVIGAGLAGCEAAWQLAKAGIQVTLIEQKPAEKSPAHRMDGLAELVCSNSLGAYRLGSASGLLKEEMRRLGSLCVEAAEACRVEAGGALAVDRDRFSEYVTKAITAHPNITLCSRRQDTLPEGPAIIATGPLTSDGFAKELSGLLGGFLSFFDAAAPIVTAESIDMEKAFAASRYGRGGQEDYLNCPLSQEEYEAFYQALITAERVVPHGFEQKLLYEGCMPIELMALRGPDTIRFGPMKPVGLRDPRTGHRPFAVVQLRRENAAGTLYNLVGFQTGLRFSGQKRVFSMIPALHDAEFVRYGVMHRNTFIDSPRLLSEDLSLKTRPLLYFAGQITGVEGYMPSAACGILAGRNLLRRLRGQAPLILPRTTMLGALIAYITDESVSDFQPMGANFGILPPLPERIRDKQARYAALSERALAALEPFLQEP